MIAKVAAVRSANHAASAGARPLLASLRGRPRLISHSELMSTNKPELTRIWCLVTMPKPSPSATRFDKDATPRGEKGDQSCDYYQKDLSRRSHFENRPIIKNL